MDLKDQKLTLHNLLKKYIVCVEFTKANGEYRKMNCTLKSDVLPANTSTQNNSKPYTGEENHMAVWDVDANGWRSFIFDNIISYEVL
jgi:hypothetical protein